MIIRGKKTGKNAENKEVSSNSGTQRAIPLSDPESQWALISRSMFRADGLCDEFMKKEEKEKEGSKWRFSRKTKYILVYTKKIKTKAFTCTSMF